MIGNPSDSLGNIKGQIKELDIIEAEDEGIVSLNNVEYDLCLKLQNAYISTSVNVICSINVTCPLSEALSEADDITTSKVIIYLTLNDEITSTTTFKDNSYGFNIYGGNTNSNFMNMTLNGASFISSSYLSFRYLNLIIYSSPEGSVITQNTNNLYLYRVYISGIDENTIIKDSLIKVSKGGDISLNNVTFKNLILKNEDPVYGTVLNIDYTEFKGNYYCTFNYFTFFVDSLKTEDGAKAILIFLKFTSKQIG